MPEYEFICNDCDVEFSTFANISQYDDMVKNMKCKNCDSDNVIRDISNWTGGIHYVKGLHECKTVGEYAEVQTKKYGPQKVEDMQREMKTQKDSDSGMKDLPTGMSRIDYKDKFLKKGKK